MRRQDRRAGCGSGCDRRAPSIFGRRLSDPDNSQLSRL